tara:strand:- start:34044 stop:34781 length:738 start_codon:yes stop_codon:yes gene_type:complete
MALNAKKAAGGGNGGNKVQQPVMEAGTYPVRLAQVIDLGIQPQRPFKGEEKPPAHMIMATYEFVDEFMLDEEGNELEDKPRWLSEEFPLYNLKSERAKSTKRYYALDPNEDHGGDWSELLGAPANALVTTFKLKNGPNAGQDRNGIQDLSAMRPRDAKKTPELQNPPKVFSLDEPDLEIFGSLPEWLQDKIKANLEYAGSALQALLEGDKPKGKGKPQAKKEEPVDEPDDAPEGTDEDEGEDTPW